MSKIVNGLNVFMLMHFIRYMLILGHENSVGASIEASKRLLVSIVFKLLVV